MYKKRKDRKASLGEIATLVEGKLEPESATSVMVKGISSLNEPEPDTIGFARGKFELQDILPAAILVTEDWKRSEEVSIPVIRAKDPMAAFLKILPHFYELLRPEPKISDKAEIHSSALIGKNVYIGAFSVIGADVVLEDGVVIHPHVTLYEGVRVGKETIIHSGSVLREFTTIAQGVTIQPGVILGADGFGYVPTPSGHLQAVPQLGAVNIESEVDIGANSCIDRGTFGKTNIGKQTKIDNLVQIGHNVHVGKQSILCGQVGIAGSAKIGNHVTIGGATGVANHVQITDKVRIGGKSGVTGNLKEPGDYAGYPAVTAKEWRRQLVALKRADRLLKKK